MEALAAFGVAANIAQFIAFATSLVSTSVEAYQNSEGCADDVSSIAATYEKLRDLSQVLGTPILDPDLLIKHPQTIKIVNNFEDLSRECKQDCDDLLNVVGKLQSKDQPPRRWRSFKSAMMTMWKATHVKDMELRLNRCQNTLTLHVLVLMSHSQRICKLQLDELQEECRKLNTRQTNKLDQIADIIANLGQFIKVRRTETADLVDLQSQMSQLSLTNIEISKGNLLLRSLMYERQNNRHMSIPTAHARTLKWVLTDDPGTQIGPTAGNLLKWLRTGKKWFWVSGKPGSGKSTLMKYLSGHKATLEALGQWSSDLPVIVGRHFFWSAGSSMQKSRQGLLQNLLYEIFSQVPELMSLTCGQRWTAQVEPRNDRPWDVHEMDAIFRHIATMKDLPVRFCFFIDGLDEYEGDHVDICQRLCNLSESPYIKLCISSRPWNVFEDTLGHDESLKLYVHEFTRQDIQQYSEDQLQAHPRWTALKNEQSDVDHLVEEITHRAEGVFLWVYLVVKELREGLSEHDCVSDLFRRVENIPTDLEVFFKQILDSVPKSYYGKMATTLQMAIRVSEPLDALFYDFSDMEHDDLEYAKNLALRFQSEQTLMSRRDVFSRRLKARTKGLLEVQPTTGKVEFLHRTVLDFLKTADMWNYLDRRAPPKFDFNRSILKALIAWVKTTATSPTMQNIIQLAASHTKDAEADTNTFAVIQYFEECLDEVILHAAHCELMLSSDTMEDIFDTKPRYESSSRVGQTMRAIAERCTGTEDPVTLFRRSILENGASGYIDYALDNKDNYFSLLPVPPMSYLLNLDTFMTHPSHLETLEILLSHNADPNEEVDDKHKTIWELTLHKFLADQEHILWSLETGLFSAMMRSGADPYVDWKNVLMAFFLIPASTSYGKSYLKLVDEVCTKIESLEISYPEICDWTEQKFPQVNDLHAFLEKLSQPSTFDFNLRETNQMHFQLLGEILVRILINVDEAGRDQIVWVQIERGLGPEAASLLRRRIELSETGESFQGRFLRRRSPSPSGSSLRKRGHREVDLHYGSRKRTKTIYL